MLLNKPCAPNMEEKNVCLVVDFVIFTLTVISDELDFFIIVFSGAVPYGNKWHELHILSMCTDKTKFDKS